MQCHGKCQMKKESREKSRDLNFERFCFDFYAPGEIISETEVSTSPTSTSQNNFHYLTKITEISLGVPNPPPNLSFS